MSQIKQRNLGQSDKYDVAKSQLERETAALMAQRRQLEGGYEVVSDKKQSVRRTFVEHTGLTPVVMEKGGEGHKTEEVVGRLQEIIRLCKDEGTLSKEEMKQVLKVENQVLSYLQRNGSQNQVRVQRPQTDTPSMDKSKLQIAQTWGKENVRDRTNMGLSEDTLEMIAEIQRKALGEIIHLQRERDQLKQQYEILLAEVQKNQGRVDSRNVGSSGEMERMREENRLLRQENYQLRNRVETLGGLGGVGRQQNYGETHTDYGRQGLAVGQYDSQIAVYENELRRAGAVINQLKNRLVNVPGIEELHEQGERIRRETAELLQRRVGSGGDANLIRQLQERLQEQQNGKAAFLQELKIFKQKYLDLEEQNKMMKRGQTSYESLPRQKAGSTPQRENASAKSNMKKKSSGLGDYEQTLNQMRRALQ